MFHNTEGHFTVCCEFVEISSYGAVTFSLTEAGKTASITVKWWKLYAVSVHPSTITEIVYGTPVKLYFNDYGSYKVICNDDSYYTVNQHLYFTNIESDAPYYASISDFVSGSYFEVTTHYNCTSVRITGNRSTTLSSQYHRYADLDWSVKPRCRAVYSLNGSTYVNPFPLNITNDSKILYLMGEDQGGYHSVDGGSIIFNSNDLACYVQTESAPVTLKNLWQEWKDGAGGETGTFNLYFYSNVDDGVTFADGEGYNPGLYGNQQSATITF